MEGGSNREKILYNNEPHSGVEYLTDKETRQGLKVEDIVLCEDCVDLKELRMKRKGELQHRENEIMVREMVEEALTFSLGDGGGRGDGAEGGAAWEGGVGPGHSHRVAHPRRWVNGSDRFICRRGEEIRKLFSSVFYQQGNQQNSWQSCTYCEAE